MGGFGQGFNICPAVVPVLVGPLQVLLTILPGLLLALAGGLFALFKPSGLKSAAQLLWRQKVAVACLAAMSIGIVYGVKQIWPRGDAGPITTAQGGNDWPTARGDVTRCAVVAGSASPTREQLIWSRRPEDGGVLASPAVVGNRVYITTARLGISKSGAICCLDADTGAVVWTSNVAGFRPTFSSPVVAGDYLVCGEGLHDTRDARVVCLRRDNGNVVWTFATKNHVECTPVVAAGRVYVGAGDDGVYCLDLKPGADGQAVVHWHKTPENFPDAETSLAVHDGKVYVGLGNAGLALVVLDALSGAELHRLEMPYPVFSPPAIADGKLYVGMGNGDYVKPGDGGAVVCIDLKAMKTAWKYELPQTVLGAVAIKDDNLFFGCNDGAVYCLSRAGKLVKQVSAFAPIKTSPAVSDAHVFIVTETGMLFAFDRHTLEPVWETRLGTDGLFISSPVVARGHVYVGTETDGLLCVGKPPSSKRSPFWSAPLGGPGVAGNGDGSAIPEEGEVRWQHPAADAKSNPVATAAAPPALWEDRMYVPIASASWRGLECVALDKDGRKAPQSLWKHDSKGEIIASPVVLGKTIVGVVGRPNAPDRHVFFLKRETGQLLVMLLLDAGASGILSATRQQVLLQDGVDRLASYDAQGTHQWSATVGQLACAPAFNDALIMAVASKPAQAVALDRATGVELWRMALSHAPNATPILEHNKFLLPTVQGLESRSLIDGQLLTSWKAELGIPSGELAVSGALVVFVNQKGEVIAFDRNISKVTARVPGAVPGQTPVVSRGKVIVAAAGRLMTITLGQENPTPELWVDLARWAPSAGLPTGPLILSGSQLFTVLPGRGVACLGEAK